MLIYISVNIKSAILFRKLGESAQRLTEKDPFITRWRPQSTFGFAEDFGVKNYTNSKNGKRREMKSRPRPYYAPYSYRSTPHLVTK